MVKETMEAVKQAEEKAESILKEAGEKANAILEKAHTDAELLCDRERAAAKEKAAQAMETAKAEMVNSSYLNKQKVKKEVDALRADAAAGEARAIEMVLKNLY